MHIFYVGCTVFTAQVSSGYETKPNLKSDAALGKVWDRLLIHQQLNIFKWLVKLEVWRDKYLIIFIDTWFVITQPNFKNFVVNIVIIHNSCSSYEMCMFHFNYKIDSCVVKMNIIYNHVFNFMNSVKARVCFSFPEE